MKEYNTQINNTRCGELGWCLSAGTLAARTGGGGGGLVISGHVATAILGQPIIYILVSAGDIAWGREGTGFLQSEVTALKVPTAI